MVSEAGIRPSRMSRFSRAMERLLWLFAIVCFTVLGWERLLALQSSAASESIMPKSAAAFKVQDQGDLPGATAQSSGEAIGKLRIAALGLSVPITAGIESSSLIRGVGHVEGSALPGGLGTLALAGHRDTYLRPLERVVLKMDIEVTDKTGTYHYMVDSWEIVTPEQVSVLSIREKPELVLITCYPFHYIGAAPKRFVVHAHLVSLAPDAPPVVKVSGNGTP